MDEAGHPIDAPASQPAEGASPAPSGATPGKPTTSGNWFWRHKVLTGLVGIVVLLGAVGALSGGNDAAPTARAGGQTSSPAPTTSTTTSTTTSPTVSASSAVEEAAATPSTSTPTPAPPALPANVTYKGRGNKVLKIRKPEEGAILATFSHKGSSNFAVFSLDSSNQETDLLVNTIGRYSGTVLLDADGSESAKLKIEADGSWTVTLKALARAREITTSAKGSGDDVLIYTGPAATLTLTNRGEGNIAVVWITEDGGDLLVNDIGRYSGESALTDGPGVLAITSDGTWTAKISE